MAFLDDRRVDQYDRDVSTLLRSLGSIVGAIGTTVTEGMERINQRSLSSLEQGVKRLHVRLRSGIRPDLCWDRFISETGSELVDRSVSIFWDTIKLGGEPDAIGYLSSLFALKISLLRENRKLVSQTFMYLMVPLHAVLIAILLFVTEVMVIFGQQLTNINQQSLANVDPATTGGLDVNVLAFASPNIAFIRGFALVVTIVLTIVDTWSPHATAGGHHHKVWLYAAVMLVLSGGALLLVPQIVGGLFSSVAGDITSTGGPTGAAR